MWIATVPPDLCLNYANTLAWRGRAEPSEELTGFEALAGWLTRAAGGDTRPALESWAGSPAKAAALLAEAIAVRETIYRVFSATAAGKPPNSSDIAAINAALEAAPPRRTLGRLSEGYGWVVPSEAQTAPALLAPVLWSAADLIVKGGAVNVRQCANEKCLWLFVDESRNGTRRWCDMSSCGNRAKAQRHYRKAKASEAN